MYFSMLRARDKKGQKGQLFLLSIAPPVGASGPSGTTGPCGALCGWGGCSPKVVVKQEPPTRNIWRSGCIIRGLNRCMVKGGTVNRNQSGPFGDNVLGLSSYDSAQSIRCIPSARCGWAFGIAVASRFLVHGAELALSRIHLSVAKGAGGRGHVGPLVSLGSVSSDFPAGTFCPPF